VNPALVSPRSMSGPVLLLPIIGVDWPAEGRYGLGERGPAGADAIRECPPASVLLSSKNVIRPRSGGEIRLEMGCEVDEIEDADDPECLLVGEDEGR
jgi:hypothetical protein